MKLASVVFPSISTGIYGYPINDASKVAIKTVKEYLKASSLKKVVFDVFGEGDYEVYYRNIMEIISMKPRL